MEYEGECWRVSEDLRAWHSCAETKVGDQGSPVAGRPQTTAPSGLSCPRYGTTQPGPGVTYWDNAAPKPLSCFVSSVARRPRSAAPSFRRPGRQPAEQPAEQPARLSTEGCSLDTTSLDTTAMNSTAGSMAGTATPLSYLFYDNHV